MTSSPSLSAIILAGGQSSRMGRDKALVSVQGVPLLRRVYEAVPACASAVYVVTPWPQRYQSLLPPACRFIQDPWLEEAQSHGPLVGFAQGLAQVRTDWALLLACDLPGLKAAVLQTWTQTLSQVPETAVAYLPRHPKGWEPLCGFYRRRCLSGLTGFIAAGGRSFQSWLAQVRVQELTVDESHMLFNCNTPQDLSRFEI